MQKIYPFRFLDSYRRQDSEFFFGRIDEIESLYQMIFQTRILLIYGTSGTGKTSLIQCGLANKFQTYDWLALNIRRGSNLLSSLDKVLCEASDEAFVYIEEKESVIRDLTAKTEAVYKANFKPVYLIFDQFEELYVLGTKKEQEHFIQAVKDILAIEQPVKIIISIREEYLGFLYDFERKVPELLRKKLRVEAMNLDKVKTVIESIGKAEKGNISLKAGEEELIAEGIFEKIRGDEKTLTIQLPYLQVFLDNLYLKITNDETRTKEAVFSLKALEIIGNIGDVLRNFLDEQVLMIAQKLDQKPASIWRMLSPFVTLDGTKEPLSAVKLHERFPNEPVALIESALGAFVGSRILRYTENEQLYEIAHDSLAKQVNDRRSDEEIAIMEVQRLIRSQVAVKPEARECFSEKQLLFIEPNLIKFKASDEELDWIAKSWVNVQEQKANEKKKQEEDLIKARHRLNVVLSLFGVAVIALFTAIYLFISTNIAKEAANNAKKEAQKSLINSYNSEIKRYTREIEISMNDSASFREYKAGEDIMTQQGQQIDSLKTERNNLMDSLRLLTDEIKK